MSKRAPLSIEWIAGDYLRSLGIAAGRVGTDLPADFELNLPRVRLGAVGANAVDRGTGHLWRHRLDVHVYGATQAQAEDVLIDVLDAFARLDVARYAHAAGVLTAAEVDLGPNRLPDPETSRERYIATVALFGHHHQAA